MAKLLSNKKLFFLILFGGILFFVFNNQQGAQAAGVPYNLKPAGATITEFPLELSWKFSGSTNQETFNYEIYQGLISDFNRDQLFASGLAVGWSAKIDYLPAGQYTWRVQACDLAPTESVCEGTSKWAFEYFTVEGGASAPTPTLGTLPPPNAPIYPANGTINIPVSIILEWPDVLKDLGLSSRYRYSYWPEGNEAAKVIGNVTSRSVLVNLAAGAKKYLWTVQSCDKNFKTCGQPNSPPWYFTTVDCPEGQTRPYNGCENKVCRSINACGVSQCNLGEACTGSTNQDTFFSGSIGYSSTKRSCENDCSLCETEAYCLTRNAKCTWDADINKCCGSTEIAWPASPLGTKLNSCSLSGLIKYLYEWGISIGGFLVFISLIIAGVQYLSSAGNSTKMREALDRIKSSVLGLILLLGSFLILNTINPQLTNLNLNLSGLENLPEEVDIDANEVAGNIFEECKQVILHQGINNSGTSIVLYPGDKKSLTDSAIAGVVSSVEMKGNCILSLYQRPSGWTLSDSDSYLITVNGDVSNMEASYNDTTFSSASLGGLTK